MTSEELESARNESEKILGKDSGFQVLKHNFTKLLACDLMSRSFIWVVVALVMCLGELGLEVDDKLSLDWKVQVVFEAHLAVACLHYAARDEFKLLCSASSDWLRGHVNNFSQKTQ